MHAHRLCQRMGHAFAGLALFLAGPATAAPGDIVNVGVHRGLRNSVGMSVNEAGQVAGYSVTPGAFGDEAWAAFRYTPGPGGAGTVEDIGHPFSHANAINGAGQVVGDYRTAAGTHAFLYTGSPGAAAFHDLDTLGGPTSYAYAINNAGQVTGTATTAALPQSGRAYIYSGVPGAGGAMADLGTLGGDVSAGHAINNLGQVAGTSNLTRAGIFHAFLYTGAPGAGGTMADLGTLGGNQSIATGLNDRGQVVGYSRLAGNFDERAFVFTGVPGAGGTMIELPTLSGRNSYAEDINDAGVIVGWAPRPDFVRSASRALLWMNDPAHTLVDLDAWLDATNPAAGAQWTLLQATDISDNGMITGVGLFNDGSVSGERAFLLHGPTYVPEPTGAALAAGAAALLLPRRRRTR